MKGTPANSYSGGYDEVLFPFLKGVTSQRERARLVKEYRNSATNEDKQRIYQGMVNYSQKEDALRKKATRTAKSGFDINMLSDAEKAEYARITENISTAQNYLYGEGDTAGDSLRGLATFAAIASGMYGISAMASGATTGISSWVSSTFGVPAEAVQAASAVSTASDVAGVISGSSGIASFGTAASAAAVSADALGGASTFSQILSGASTIGKIAGAAGSIFDLVGGSGAAGAYSTFLEADAAKAAATGKARDYNEQAESYDYLASQAGRNRQVSLQNYIAEQQRLAVESGRIARANKRSIGSTTAAYGAAGVALESGSVQEVLMDSAAEGELDLAIENFNSKQKQRNYLIEADALAEEEAFNKRNAARARENAALSLQAGNSISDMLRKQGTVQGVEAGINIIKGAGSVASSVQSVLDLF